MAGTPTYGYACGKLAQRVPVGEPMLDVRRRDFITLLGGAATAWPVAARGQQIAKLPIIGFLGASTPSAWVHWTAAFLQRLRQLGWIEGRTVGIEYRWEEGHSEGYADSAAEFVHRNVDVIITVGRGVPAAKQVTSTIPIVFAIAVARSEAGWWLHWRDRVVMPLASPFSPPNWLETDSKSCTRRCQIYDAWRVSAMSTMPARGWRFRMAK